MLDGTSDIREPLRGAFKSKRRIDYYLILVAIPQAEMPQQLTRCR
jgi:hypothetical protein